MSSTLSFSLIITLFLALIMIAVSYKSGHFIKSLFLTLVSGTGALFAVNLLTPYTGVGICLNYISFFISGVFGIPGVIAMLFMK